MIFHLLPILWASTAYTLKASKETSICASLSVITHLSQVPSLSTVIIIIFLTIFELINYPIK